MNLRDLHYIIAVADLAHFGRAADACHVSQPTLSGQILKLEEELGVKIFEREGRSVRPTAVGTEIVARARQSVAAADEINALARASRDPLAGPIRLGIIPTLAPYMMPWMLPRAAEALPRAPLKITEDLTGNLREALIRAALELIASKGAAGFTFAEAARYAGVSPAAPYRHFRDRDELMASVALRGFEQFEAMLTRAWDEGRPDGFVALERLGKAYLDFARAEPAFFSAMFEAGIPAAANTGLREAGDRALGVVRAAAERLCAAMPAAGRPPALMVALHVWSMTHGIATLFARGDAARRALPMSAAELLEAELLVYFRGLGAKT